MMPTYANEVSKFHLVMPKWVHDWLREVAQADYRSVNAEIVALLVEAKERRDQEAVHES